MFREPEGKKIFETDRLVDAPTNADEVKMDFQKVYGAKDTSGTLSSVKSPISVAEPKPLSSNTHSRSIFPPNIPSFSFKCYKLTR